MNFRPLVIALCTLSALFAGDALSQGSVTLDVTVIDNQGRILAGLPVVMRERATASEVRTRTDAAGTARFKLSSGKQWLVYVDGRRYGSDFIDIVDGSEVEQSMIITHDPAYDDRIARQSFRRDTLTETDIRSAPLPSSSLPGHTLLEVVVRNSGGVVLPGMRVRVVDLAASSAWWKLSDAAGRVVFHLPVGRSYDIDVEDQLNATYFDPVSMGEGRSMTSRLTMTYDRYQVSEQRRGDTIRQRVAAGEPLRHSKGLLRLHVERDHMAAAGETVYINDVRSSRVWEAVTDSAGETVFVLPFGTRYLVHFRYQRDVEAVDFTRARKQAEAALGLTYTPDPEQEHPGRFVPVQWRNSVWPFDRYRRSPYPDSESGKGPRMVLRASGPVRAGRVSGILQAGIRIPTLDASAVGPLNIGFVLDISGSMASEDNIERMKAGVIQMLQAMRPDDVVSITLFDDKPELLLPAQRLGKDLPRIAALVRTLAPRGGTVVSEALRVAARQVASGKADGASPNLVLVTDGWIYDPVDSVMQLFKGNLAGLPCIPVGTGELSNAVILQRIGALFGRQPILLAGDSLEFLLSRKIFAKIGPLVSDIRFRYILPAGVRLADQYGGRHDSLHHGVVLNDGAAYPEEEFTALFGLTRGAGYQGGKVGVVASWHDIRRGRRDSILQWVDPFASPDAASAADIRRLYSLATGVASLEHMVLYGVSRSFEPAIASLQDGLKTIDALQSGGSTRDADVEGLKTILEASLAVMRELRRKSLLPH